MTTASFEDDMRRRVKDRALAAVAAHLVGLSVGVGADSIMAPRRTGLAACRARYVAMYLTHVSFGWPLHRVGAAFGRDRCNVGIACRWTEDARDDPALDAQLDAWEAVLQQAARSPALELAA